MDLGLKGKWAIVGASSRGLGKGCAMALAEAGCNLVINGMDEARLAATAEELKAASTVEIIAVPGDIGSSAVQDALFAAAPTPDVLVTNNGGPPVAQFEALDRAAILSGVEKNMIMPIELIQRALPGMKQRGFGRIVNITSSSVLAPIPGLDVSSGARAGLTAFIAGVAKGAAAHNVTINNLLPGKMDTDRLRGNLSKQAERTGQSMEDTVAGSIAAIPAKRFGTADEFGATCAFLCSAHAGYMTGQNVLLDGGLLGRAF
ncbi:MAG: SDR family oxidoreductase [Devosiaceae bacterium]|nr:SDR family oxidoreductase [Devosiaceae bacterium MH13]